MSKKNSKSIRLSAQAYRRLKNYPTPVETEGKNSGGIKTVKNLFLIKNRNGVLLDRMMSCVSKITILQLDKEGYYSPIDIPYSWDIFWFHDLPQLLELEVKAGEYVEYRFFRFDYIEEVFVEVIYDEDNYRFVDVDEYQ